MAKKKKEHVTFDRKNKAKPSLPFAKTNRLTAGKTGAKNKTAAAQRNDGGGNHHGDR